MFFITSNLQNLSHIRFVDLYNKWLCIMNKLGNYITGNWITGDGDGQLLYNAVTAEPIGAASTKGLDFAAITDYARTVGNPALRKMTFHARGNMLKALAFI
jgi:oxepin-CoA hydrolase/3-oxo-5,6-dehydrosuberyl-CoA semialdehyde dehydrogenase